MPTTLTNGASVNTTINAVTTATDITLTAPSPNNWDVGVYGGDYTVALHPAGSKVAAPVTVTPDDGGAGGTFNPATVVLSNAAPSGTFKYKNPSAGTKVISITNNSSSVL